ncbi:MAG TPA: polynucleotide adenylyltransferase [Treponema sp.]|nr:polynucleotide adenylyltransferase [Treponema sp.]
MNSTTKAVKIPAVLKKMHDIFASAGFQSYLVGGAVRDMIMGKEPHDYDVATDAGPQDVMKLFNRVIPTGIEHGTVTVLLMGYSIETTTFRTESGYSDGRHPDSVRYAATIEEDLSRRDFTMNAIAVNLSDGVIVDPFHGRGDIEARLIRTVGNAHERFSEDGLRPVRALRFAAQLNFSIEKDTYSDIFEQKTLAVVRKISIERFRDEFTKMLASDRPSVALKMMEETGIMNMFLPEFSPCRGCEQKDVRGFHEFDVLDHLFYACDGAPKDNLVVRLAALFHDIGKPAVKRTEHTEAGDVNTFYNHEQKSAAVTETVLTRLRYPTKIVNDVVHLVKEHMFHYESSWSDAAVRRFIVRVGTGYMDDLFDLRLADMYGMHRLAVRVHDSEAGKNLVELRNRIAKVTAEKSAMSLRELAVNGKDLMEAGIPAGKDMGRILNELLSTVLDDPAQNTKEALLTIAKNIYARKEL